MKHILIAGLGYTARALLVKHQGDYKFTTASRSAEADITFDYTDTNTWSSLPEADACIITFPLRPFSLIESFSKVLNSKFSSVVVIGTTGSIQVEYEHQVVNENSKFDNSDERSKSENYLLSQGASIVHSAGIYGPNRDPRNWVMRGLVGPEEKYVNFIHVNDLARFIMAAVEANSEGKRYLASDASPQKWSDLIERWKREYNLVSPAEYKKSKRNSKQIDPSVSTRELGVKLQFKNIHEGLCGIGH